MGPTIRPMIMRSIKEQVCASMSMPTKYQALLRLRSGSSFMSVFSYLSRPSQALLRLILWSAIHPQLNLRDGQAPIHGDYRAGHISTCGRGEEEYHPFKLMWHARSPERRPFDHILTTL